jgi:hypothetical protein
MGLQFYILNDKGSPVPVGVIEWAKWFGEHKNIRQETIGRSWISTIFLGLDYEPFRGGPPVLWETMVFGGKCNQEGDRCAGSKEQAEAMHEAMVKRVCKVSGIRYRADRTPQLNKKLLYRLHERHRKHLKKGIDALANRTR